MGTRGSFWWSISRLKNAKHWLLTIARKRHKVGDWKLLNMVELSLLLGVEDKDLSLEEQRFNMLTGREEASLQLFGDDEEDSQAEDVVMQSPAKEFKLPTSE